MGTALILGDITGKSRVAVRMLTGALESRGHEVLALPTALISNTLNLGKHAALDTTDYLLASLDAWEALGIRWDCVLIGYVTGLSQAKVLCDVADKSRAHGAWVLVDPILGDGGRMYNSVTADQAEGMRMLARHADIVTPNLTEACLLAGMSYEALFAGGQEGTSNAFANERTPACDAQDAMLRALSGDGKRSVLITSAATADGGSAVLGFDAKTGGCFTIPFERVPGRHFGTGDLFSALLTDALLRGMTLEGAAREASEAVGRAIRGEGADVLPK